jgi:hypothetical protein
VASERQLRPWREDAHVRDAVPEGRWKDERGLGQVHFTGNGLHLSVGETSWLEKDSQLIAAELPISKDIDRNERVGA